MCNSRVILYAGLAVAVFGLFLSNRAYAQIDVDKIVKDVMETATEGLVEVSTNGVSDNSFRRLFGRAKTSVNKRSNIALESGQLKGIASSDRIESDAIGGSWRVMLNGFVVKGNDDVIIQQAPAIIMNNRNSFRYLFFSQEIRPRVFDQVNEKLAELHDEIIKEYDDVEVSIGRNENRMTVNAHYFYVDGDDEIEDRLKFLMNQSREIISDLLVETPKLEKEAREDLRDKALTYLNRDDFVFLIDDRYEDLTDKEDAPEGHWDFSNKSTGASYEIFNFGDRLVFSIYEQMPEFTDEAQRDVIVTQVASLVAKEPAKGAGSMEVIRHPDASNYVWAKFHYALDGQVKGENVADYYREFKREYSEDLHKEIQGLFKGYEKDAEKYLKEMRKKTYSTVTQDEYMLLADDELEDNVDPQEGIEQGHWNFTAGDQERDLEVFNFGDRVMYTLAMEMPTESAEERSEIETRVRTLMADHPMKGAYSTEVSRYPEYDGYIWIKVSYGISDGVKGSDINKQYRKFVYDDSDDLYGRVEL
jgi:hypothetical protein